MARTIDFDRYVAACNFPGALDEQAVTRSLEEYLAALNVTRTVRKLPSDWDLATEEPLRRSIGGILDDLAQRIGWEPRDALAALAALAARAARDARDARDASDALAALAARDALDARAALAAGDALAARDALAAGDAGAARDARDALDARAALAAGDAGRSADALRRFTQWCLYRGSWFWYGWELSWVATTLIGSQQTGAALPWARPLFEAYVAGAWMLYWTDDTLYWIAKPAVHVEAVDGARRLHCDDGPTLECDVENLYFVHGVMVPAFVVVRPDWITVQHIQQEENAEVRRVMLERYGFDRFVTDSGATAIQSDEVGTLYRTEFPDDEPLVVVKVRNSTPESDGHFKDYVLRVPPDTTSARGGIAWSFDMKPEDYRPMVET